MITAPALGGTMYPAVQSVSVGHDPQVVSRAQLWLRLSDASGKLFADLTSKHVGTHIVVRVDGKQIGVPIRINTPIAGGAVALPVASREEAETLAKRLKDGKIHLSFDFVP